MSTAALVDIAMANQGHALPSRIFGTFWTSVFETNFVTCVVDVFSMVSDLGSQMTPRSGA